eukprot:FR735899.1.p1 GENE.FR735899.1~~FR735899.1.p1  ORF type:complete len:197 (+),score=19.17 FR735899.1:1-591(+)
MKYSKRTLELINTEDHLVGLKLYNDAKNVRRMIDKVLPGEEAEFYAAHDSRIDLMRRRLVEAQEEDVKRLNERVSALRWSGVRSRAKDMSTTQHRVQCHEVDMMHAHHLVTKKQPELAVNPTATWQLRKGHEATSAHMRGQQLLNKVKGNQKKQAVFVASLCDVHDFEQPESGTVRYGYETQYGKRSAGGSQVSRW